MQPLHFNNNNNSSFDIIKNITIWQHGNNRIITIGKADIMLSLTKQDPGRRLHKQNKTAKYQWSTASFDFHQMAVHKRTQMLAHCNLKQNMWLCSKQSSFFPFMHCPLVANRKTWWSILKTNLSNNQRRRRHDKVSGQSFLVCRQLFCCDKNCLICTQIIFFNFVQTRQRLFRI